MAAGASLEPEGSDELALSPEEGARRAGERAERARERAEHARGLADEARRQAQEAPTAQARDRRLQEAAVHDRAVEHHEAAAAVQEFHREQDLRRSGDPGAKEAEGGA